MIGKSSIKLSVTVSIPSNQLNSTLKFSHTMKPTMYRVQLLNTISHLPHLPFKPFERTIFLKGANMTTNLDSYLSFHPLQETTILGNFAVIARNLATILMNVSRKNTSTVNYGVMHGTLIEEVDTITLNEI